MCPFSSARHFHEAARDDDMRGRPAIRQRDLDFAGLERRHQGRMVRQDAELAVRAGRDCLGHLLR